MIDLNSLSYLIMPAKFSGTPPFLNLHNRIYEFWHQMFTDVLRSRDPQASVNPDHFIRQNRVAAIINNNDIVALHLYTFFNFSSVAARENPYFSDFTKSTWGYLEKENLKHVMTMEYLSVNPSYRKSKSGFSFGEIMVGLGFKIMKESQQDCTLGIARQDMHVDKMGQNFGGTPIQPGIWRYDYECSLMLSRAEDAHDHPDKNTQSLVNHLWNQRIDFINDANTSSKPLPLAA